MRRIKEADMIELKMRIENITCHIDDEVLKENKFVSIRAMIDETDRLRSCLILLDKNGTIDISKLKHIHN